MSWTSTPPWEIDEDDDGDPRSARQRAADAAARELDEMHARSEAAGFAAMDENERQRFARRVGLEEDVDGGPYLAVRRWLR